MVVKYNITIDKNNTSGYSINFPLFNSNDENLLQEETLNNQFVDTKIEEVINPIIDYEKVRFSPYITSGTSVYYNGVSSVFNDNKSLDKIEYRLNFLDENKNYYSTSFPDEYSDSYDDTFSGSSYYDIGYNQADFKFQRNNLMKSFMTLLFYDSDDLFTQNLVFYNIMNTNIKVVNSKVNEVPVRFVGSDPIKIANFSNYNTDTYVNSNGFFLYNYKVELIDSDGENIPKVLYMKAQYNNAKTGKVKIFMNTNTQQTISNLNINKNLFTKYILEKKLINNTYEYIYKIDDTYSNNAKYVSHIGDNNLNEDVLVINLYELNVE